MLSVMILIEEEKLSKEYKSFSAFQLSTGSQSGSGKGGETETLKK